ncbi:hypothetical protein BDB01DRAFT_719147 [Pilobolus umbonatus]|nr:hypothetical protein BDB01DRAFT_719147 [Pilobolus umbonatus]
MPLNKIQFQPKEARTISIHEEDDGEYDVDSLFGESTKKRTGTQALVEFLKTTSPEEFQRPPERSTHNIFSRMRKIKRPPPTPSMSTHRTIHRKNYIEIIPQSAPKNGINHNNNGSLKRSTSMDATSSPSFVLRNSTGDPILPNKKRESSLYSDSLRYSVSVRSQLSHSTGKNRSYIRESTSIKESASIRESASIKATETYLNAAEGLDTIEAALLQRLERIRLGGDDIPSNIIATDLATEHIRALGITHALENVPSPQKHVRHMQVQTDSLEPEDTEYTELRKSDIALAEALDHFEVISGLAYKKLRELWEEKMRWENACMALRDRLLSMEQPPLDKEKHAQDEALSEYPIH